MLSKNNTNRPALLAHWDAVFKPPLPSGSQNVPGKLHWCILSAVTFDQCMTITVYVSVSYWRIVLFIHWSIFGSSEWNGSVRIKTSGITSGMQKKRKRKKSICVSPNTDGFITPSSSVSYVQYLYRLIV